MATRRSAGPAAARTRTPAQVFALVIGAVYLLVGLIGFAVTGFDDFASRTNEQLIVFYINPMHNIVHIGLGVVWLISASSHATARLVNLVLGLVLLLVALVGFLDINALTKLLNIHSAGDADNFLHLVTGALSVYFGTAGGLGARPAAT